MKKYTEIYFTKSKIEACDWEHLTHEIGHYLGFLKRWKLIISLEDKLHYYLETNVELPVHFINSDCFLLKSVGKQALLKPNLWKPTLGNISDTITELYYKNELKKKKILKQVIIKFFKISDYYYASSFFILKKHNKLIKEKKLICLPFSMLKINFNEEKNFQYQKANYLDIKKSLALLNYENNHAILEVETFPYDQKKSYINLEQYEFDKHSLIVGASGTGKSKLMGLLTSAILQNKKNYKVVMIDPHASLKDDIGGLDGVALVDFETLATSISLFGGKKEDAFATTELYLSLFSSLLNGYNSKLERVLRHSIYLLLYLEGFTFENFRNLLLNLEYRLELLKKNDVSSVTHFFMGDFNELKNQSYGEAIAPIISFLDEMELVFKNTSEISLKEKLKENPVTIFSLDSMKLGTHTIQTISGFLMQQMLYLGMQKEIEEHIIFMVDEVSVLENPILSRMLSEARKYGISVVLVQQYFDQISESLKNSIFANTQNYYVFRVSIKDAEELKSHLELNLEENQKVKLLSTLKNQECVVRLGRGGTLYPALKAKTMFLNPVPFVKKEEQIEESKEEKKIYSFQMEAQTSMKEILKNLSSSRKKVL